MPFQSEKQRRYLWANEPEIARDWTDTYGSRIESNTGGISRLGFEVGSPKYKLEQYKKEKSMIDQWRYDQQMQHDFIEDQRRKKVKEQKHMAATGGIMRLGYADGPITDDMGNTFENTQYKDLTEVQFDEKFGGMNYQVTEEKEETGGNPLEKLMNLSPVKAAMNLGKKMFAPQDLTQAQHNMNNQFLTSQGIGFMPNNPYQMVGGPFAGMNAPGTSAFGSKDVDQMATKWLNKYGHTAPTEKVHQMSALAGKDTGNPAQMGISNPVTSYSQSGVGGSNKGAKEGYSYGLNRGGIVDLWRR